MCATSFTLHFHVVQSWKYRFANQLFSFATEVAGTCGWLRHVIKWCRFDRWQKKIHNNQFEAQDALRKNGATVKMFFAINTFQSVVAGLKQPGSMTGFGNVFFFAQFVFEEI